VRSEPVHDARGYFVRVYEAATFRSRGLVADWVHENQSLSVRAHTVRGLHFQRPPHAETKLVRVLRGRVLDVFVDLRLGSPTYGRSDAVELWEDGHTSVYIPKGFAHGFCTLTNDAVVAYKVDEAYAKEAEGGIRWDDPDLAIAWPTTSPVISDRDRALPLLRHLVSPFHLDG
jgi:dTDP-4-dehydrorhamnose 3,5-epimerase